IGFSRKQSGVDGFSESKDGVKGFGLTSGVHGISTIGFGVWGTTYARKMAGVAAQGPEVGLYSESPNVAGLFKGDVVVQGSLVVTGTKHAVVRGRRGKLKLMYCTEAPEPWFEDLGEGTLVHGRAEIRLDPEFVGAVRGAYQVHLTAYAPLQIWVSARRR